MSAGDEISAPSGEWAVAERRGPVGRLHEPLPGDRRLLSWFLPSEPALVLGSSQPIDSIDALAVRRLGLSVVRRRSGGGAVLIRPGEIVWADLVIPRHDPLWSDDVGTAMWWVGEVWAEALGALGVAGAAVHRGPPVSTPWARTVCFDGLGTGEVTVEGAKAVGVSQRRTRDWARFQTAVHLRWDEGANRAVVAPPRPAVGELGEPYELTAPLPRLRAAIHAALSQRTKGVVAAEELPP